MDNGLESLARELVREVRKVEKGGREKNAAISQALVDNIVLKIELHLAKCEQTRARTKKTR